MRQLAGLADGLLTQKPNQYYDTFRSVYVLTQKRFKAVPLLILCGLFGGRVEGEM